MRPAIVLDNIENQETVHQRCLLITGRCQSVAVDEGHVEVAVSDQRGRLRFPEQRWPMFQGHFKALTILQPGNNVIRVTASHDSSYTTEISVTYIPLLQRPPLHLAILVAKNSPLSIDCPPGKFGGLSSAHSSLNAAIAKFRVTAYMWQALTAEEMRSNGLGRRSFRLEEEWGRDTLSATFANNEAMQATAKVHLIRSELTVAELRDHQRAQQNPRANDRQKDELHSIFSKALLAHGAPFTKASRPVVAGMILDSHYDMDAKLIVGHAALGAHDPDGLSLGIFGSHLTYSWPRFMEEVPDCLLDTEIPGNRVGNDNGECESMWEACSVGQGAFLHEVGHAFSAPHSSGIMMRGYSGDWPKCFLSKTVYCRRTQTEGISPVTAETLHDCHWDVRDLLRFRTLPHFRQPDDKDLHADPPSVELREDEEFLGLTISSTADIARVSFNQKVEPRPSVSNPLNELNYTLDELEARFDKEKPLEMEVTAMNGTERVINVWKFFKSKSFIRIPGTNMRLSKASVACYNPEDDDCAWMVPLKRRGRNGSLVSAYKMDIRVGCALDGAVVFYKDGSSAPCGRAVGTAPTYGMGGHQAKKIVIPAGVDIEKVAVNKAGSWDLNGLRIFLSNGKAMGALNKNRGSEIEVLAPEKGHRVVGFYGTSGRGGMCKEFGIVTADKNLQLPASAYDYLESQQDHPNKLERDSDADDLTSEDEDYGYDHESDVGTI
ncbi:hypothetical protein NLU13_7344 [Sarocladium strictum]|uniref:Zinc metalloproteinase n=1 Tax=Sarocladium strictum TaxID=5046 RepID=A0AA39GD63_SARSR|nr:hypothetical protein NLU13_7344 [Sarocladium strictum]